MVKGKQPPRPKAKDDRRQCPICLDRVPPERYAEHHARCLRLRAELERLDAALEPMSAQPPGPRTSDGFPVGQCPLCHRRVCRVGRRYHEITQSRAGEPHLCDGHPSGGRRTHLLYVNRRAAITKRVNSARRRPKNGGPRGA